MGKIPENGISHYWISESRAHTTKPISGQISQMWISHFFINEKAIEWFQKFFLPCLIRAKCIFFSGNVISCGIWISLQFYFNRWIIFIPGVRIPHCLDIYLVLFKNFCFEIHLLWKRVYKMGLTVASRIHQPHFAIQFWNPTTVDERYIRDLLNYIFKRKKKKKEKFPKLFCR